MRFLKNMFLTFFKYTVRMVYYISSSIKKQDNKKVIFVLSRTERLEGNLQFIYSELKRQLPDAKIHLVYTENKVNLRIFKDILLLSNATYLIIDDYYLPIYLIKPRNELKVIQLWHAAGALKKFGYSTVGTKFGPSPSYLKRVPIHSNYTHVYVSSSNAVKPFADAFNMSSSHVFPYGVPRTDLFNERRMCEAIKKSIIKQYPILDDEGIVRILVAPTYRAGGRYGESEFDFIDYFKKNEAQLHSNIAIIFKPHPYMRKSDLSKLETMSNVIMANSHSINEWMLVSDAFVTDYSSAIFEFALLKMPLAHFIPDADEYNSSRGLYSKIEDVSDGTILKSEYALINWLNNRSRNECFDTSRMVSYNFDYINDISKKVVNHFLTH